MAALLEKAHNRPGQSQTSKHTRESNRIYAAMEKAKEIRMARDSGKLTEAQADAALKKVRSGKF